MGSSQLRLRGFQSFLASIAVFVVDLTLTPVQPCLKKSDLINPVVLVLVLFVSHLLGRNSICSHLHRVRLPLPQETRLGGIRSQTRLPHA